MPKPPYPAASAEPLVLADLEELAAHPERLSWEPFRPGIGAHWIRRSEDGGLASALLRYAPGTSLARHRHTGVEHIFVLAGEQRDEQGRHAKGTLLMNPPGSAHSVSSPTGCIVLVIWEKPVVFDS
jgi:anti-sigma factor ChrR (cupin superfamily)